MDTVKLTLTITCKKVATVAIIQDQANHYISFSTLCSVVAERIAADRIKLTWETAPEKAERQEKMNLYLSRHFYRIFSPFFRLALPDEDVEYAFHMEDVCTTFPVSILKNLLISRNAACTVNEQYTNANGAGHARITVNIQQKGLLRNEMVFIHYLLLICASMTAPHRIRHEIVKQEIIGTGAQRLLDLGCGDGSFLMDAYESCGLRQICGIEYDYDHVKKAQKRARFRGLRKEKAYIFKADIERIDERFSSYNIVTLIEVIEHISTPRLAAFGQALFGKVNPDYVIITTPNSDYNKHLIMPGKFRHNEHFFEWSYAEFKAWADTVCAAYNYDAEIIPAGGPVARDNSFVSQLALFKKKTVIPALNSSLLLKRQGS